MCQSDRTTSKINIFRGDEEQPVGSGEVTSEIMQNHAPIISTLTQGKVRVILEDNQEKLFDISGGVIESNENKLIILVD